MKTGEKLMQTEPASNLNRGKGGCLEAMAASM
jgi:hypothetical protein